MPVFCRILPSLMKREILSLLCWKAKRFVLNIVFSCYNQSYIAWTEVQIKLNIMVDLPVATLFWLTYFRKAVYFGVY